MPADKNSNMYNDVGRVGNTSRMPKLTSSQLALVNRRLDLLEKHGKAIALDVVGLKLAEDHPTYSLYEVQKSGKYTYRNMTVPKDRILVQHDVIVSDMRKLLHYYTKLPLPDMVRLSDGYFWVGEGHHRLHLMILASIPIRANVQIRPKETASESAMRSSKIIQLALSINKEMAAEASSVETANAVMGDDPAIDNVLMALYRANKILDRKKDDIIFEHITITNKAIATRAASAYDEAYLLRLPLSLDAVQELVQGLISGVAKFKISPPASWLRISKGEFNLAVADSDLEDDANYEPESDRVGADI